LYPDQECSKTRSRTRFISVKARYKCSVVVSCIVLYCIVLYCVVLYCIVLYCIVLHCIVIHADKHRKLKTGVRYSLIIVKARS